MSVFDGSYYRWDELPPGPATTERIRQFYSALSEQELRNSQYRYCESPNGFGWDRRPISP
jgi:hypothetical protein